MEETPPLSKQQLSLFNEVDEKFSNKMIYFSLFVMILCFSTTIEPDAFLILNCIIFGGLFFYDQYRSSKVVCDILETSFYHHKKPENTPIYFSILLSSSLLSWSLSLTIHFDNTSLTFVFLYSFLRTTQVFLLFSSLKSFLIYSSILSQYNIRCGFFGILVRFAIIIRKFFMLPIWFNYIKGIPSKYLRVCYYVIYISVFLTHVIHSLYDSMYAYKNFKLSMHRQFKQSSSNKHHCYICRDEMTEPIILPCGHTHCYTCTHQWTKKKSVCLTCRAPISGTKLMDFSDGTIPFSIILFCL